MPAPRTMAIVLAAGQGTRMKSALPKVLHPVGGLPMIDHVLGAIADAGVNAVHVVCGFGSDEVRKHIGSRAQCVLQRERKGTAHAVRMARPRLKGFRGDVVVICGDTPLIRPETIKALLEKRRSTGAAGVVLTAILPRPGSYGRIIRNRDGSVRRIVEAKDTNDYEEAVTEVNAGTYAFEAEALLKALDKVRPNNAQKEYYLTDVVEILREAGRGFEAQVVDDPDEMIGINSRLDLATAEAIFRRRTNDRHMAAGVTIIDPANTHIDPQARIANDVVIWPGTTIQGASVIGTGAVLGPHATIVRSTVGPRAVVRHSLVEDTCIVEGRTVGPFAHVK